MSEPFVCIRPIYATTSDGTHAGERPLCIYQWWMPVLIGPVAYAIIVPRLEF